jgi:hypothetical protein
MWYAELQGVLAMKRYFLILLVFSSAVSGFTQEDPIPDRDFFSSGFGGAVATFSHVNESFAVFAGGRGGLIINQTFILGCGGYVLINSIPAPPPNADLFLNMVYFGAECGYIHNPDRLFYFTISTLIGLGSSTLRDAEFNEMADDDFFFVFEPAASLMMNITSSFRMGLGGGYRYVTGVTEYGLSSTSLSGLSCNLIFEFGNY